MRRPSSRLLHLFALLFATALFSPGKAEAQTAFARNDSYDFRGTHDLRISGSDIDHLSVGIASEGDFRTFKLHMRAIGDFDNGYSLQRIRVDMNNDGAYDFSVYLNEVTGTYTFPEPANGVSQAYTARVELGFMRVQSAYFRYYDCPITVLSSNIRVFANPQNDAIVQLRNQDAHNRTPILLVEGFDAENQSYPETYYRSMLDLINNELYPAGHEVFVLNFHDGGADLRSNATVVRAALDRVHAECPNQKIAVVGLSMGGVIVRYALAEAEQQAVDTHVGLFVSYDSPQGGAHFSPDFQGWISGQSSGNEVIASLQSVLQSTAAKTMLLYNTYDPTQVTHDTFYAELDALNGTGYPHNSYNVAVSNGTFGATYGWEQRGRHLATFTIIGNGSPILPLNVYATEDDLGAGSTFTNLQMVRYGDMFQIPFVVDVDYRFEISFNPVFIPTWSALGLDTEDLVMDPVTGDILSHGPSPFDEYVTQTTPQMHNTLTDATRLALMGWLGKQFNLTVSYDCSEGGSIGPETFAISLLHGGVVNVQPKTVTVNGLQVTYQFDRWDDGSTQNPRTFFTKDNVARTAFMVAVFSTETARWSQEWSATQDGLSPAVTVDANGVTHILTRTGTFSMVHGVRTTPCSWSFESIDAVNAWGFGDQYSIASGAQGALACTYLRKTDFYTYQLRYVRGTPSYSGHSWSTPVDIASAEPGPVSVKIDAAGTAHIAFVRPASAYYTGGVWYAAFNASGVQQALEFVSSQPWAGFSGLSLALDSQGRPGIAYSTSTGSVWETGSYGLGFAKRVNGVWTNFGGGQIVQSSGGWGASLGFDQLDQPKISHLYAGNSTTVLHYTTWSNITSSWTDSWFASDLVPVAATTTALALSPATGKARVAIWSTGDKPTLLWEGTRWGKSSLDVSGPPVSELSVALDADGSVVLGFSNSTRASVARALIGGTPDLTGPGTVTDLHLMTGKNTAIALWTAPGDDGDTGIASLYDIRYSTLPITSDGLFNSAPSFQDVPCPESPGSQQCAGVTGLQMGRSIYVALKVRDGAGRWSPMSNVSYGVTKRLGPDIMCESSNGPARAEFVEDEDGVEALAFAIKSGNPSRGPVSIELAVPKSLAGHVLDVSIHDVLGRRIANVASGSAQAGREMLTWDLRQSDGTPARGGMYFVRMRLGDQTMTRTIVTIR